MRLKIKYPSLTLFGLSIVVAVLLSATNAFELLFVGLGDLGYVGAFLSGLLFPMTFTAPVATVALFHLGAAYDPTSVILLGTLGALVGDLTIFTFVKDHTLAEIKKIRAEYRINHRTHDHYRRHRALIELFKKEPFHALALFAGGILIMSPFPDEFGIAILATYGVKLRYFIPLSILLNGIGILLIVILGFEVG